MDNCNTTTETARDLDEHLAWTSASIAEDANQSSSNEGAESNSGTGESGEISENSIEIEKEVTDTTQSEGTDSGNELDHNNETGKIKLKPRIQ
jgi:hypothetical protein